MNPVNSQDIQKALSEILPVIAREAYFTAALFGLSSRHMDGREKKRNFESANREAADVIKKCSLGENIQLQLSLLRQSDIVKFANAEQTSYTRLPRDRIAIMDLLEPIDDPKLDRYKRKGGDELFALNSVEEIEGPRQYDKQGLLLRESSTASETKRRLNYKPIDFHIQLQVDLIPPGNAFGIVSVILGVKYGTLVSRSETGDRFRWKPLCDDEAREEFGITPLHILEQLQGTDYTPSK